MKSTIDDVAGLAGVSPATVSRVLNGNVSVSSDKADRVRRAIAALDYEPFGPAQAMRQHRARHWAAIVADIGDPFLTAAVRAIEDVAFAHGHRLVLCNADDSCDKAAAYIDTAIRERMAGVVIAVAAAKRSDVQRLADATIPVVSLGRRCTGAAVDAVLADDRGGALDAVGHLLASGWRRIGCVLGPDDAPTIETDEGYQEALARRGADPRCVGRSAGGVAGGYDATRALLTSAEPPDALFVGDHLMTLGALHAIDDLGLRVPGDLGLVGCDDAPGGELRHPRLTVVARPTLEMGRMAAEQLLRPRSSRSRQDVVLSPTLHVRASSQRAR